MLVYQRVYNQFQHGFKGFDVYFLSLSETLQDGVWPPDDRNGDETVDLRVAYFQPTSKHDEPKKNWDFLRSVKKAFHWFHFLAVKRLVPASQYSEPAPMGP